MSWFLLGSFIGTFTHVTVKEAFYFTWTNQVQKKVITTVKSSIN